jgi:putative peptidoglycan lipid II flippase
LQVNALMDKIIAKWLTFTAAAPTVNLLGWELTKPLEAGAVTWVSFGERLYQFPLGVLAVALATAVFPLFSRHVARGDTEGLRDSVNRAIRLAVFEGLPSGVGLLLLAGPMAQAIFARRAFSAYDAAETAHLVRVYGLGMWAFCAQHILLRAFYAMRDTRTPLKVALVVVVLNFALNLLLIWRPTIRHAAFGLSTSITASINVLVLSWILRRHLGRLGVRSLVAGFARAAAGSAVMAGTVLAVMFGLDAAGVDSPVLTLVACVPAGAGAFFATTLLIRAPELRELLARPGRKGGANRGS